MDSDFKQELRFLDTDAEREALAADIRRVRQSVIQLAERVPEERHFEPRYHGWSLAAMLTHLNTMDHLTMLMIKLALLGIRPSVSPEMNDWLNDTSARVFQRRVVATTLRGMKRYEPRIIDMIMTLPMDRFSREVSYPPTRSYITVEQALQRYYLFHWQEHLQTMERGEGIYYEPPATSSEM